MNEIVCTGTEFGVPCVWLSRWVIRYVVIINDGLIIPRVSLSRVLS